MQPVAVGRFHDDDLGLGGRCRRAQQWPPGIANIAREQNRPAFAIFDGFHENARGTENVAGVEERRAKARRQLDRRAVAGGPAESVERVHGVERGSRAAPAPAIVAMLRRRAARACRASSSCRCAASSSTSRANSRVAAVAIISPRKPRLSQQRQSPAMVEMGVGEQDEIDRRGVEAERRGVLLRRSRGSPGTCRNRSGFAGQRIRADDRSR